MRKQIEKMFERYRLEKYYKPGPSEFVEHIEGIVEELPETERDIIRHRYMCREYDYISDYTIYEGRVPMSDKLYRKIRKRAFEKIITMANSSDYKKLNNSI